MNLLDLNLWQQVLDHIQRELPSQAYETWFEPTRAVASTESSLVVEVPNTFFRDWISTHYTELVGKTLETLLDAPVRVEYTVPAQNRPAAQKKPAGSGPFRALRPGPAAAQTPSTWSAAGASASSDIRLNARYTFEEFVIGPSNRFAHAAALAITESPARAYNPFFIHGGVGLGKTHLMQAIGHRMRERYPDASCLYLSSERFTNQLISALQNRSMTSFRERFRSADVLIIDDIHFIGGKESTQEAFFHTFNALYDSHKQIIISSDRPPKELRGVEERLISRFEWGLVTDIQPPDLETRVAILRRKAEVQGCRVPDPVTLFIAERITSNIRELEGALNRVIACSVLTGQEISLEMAQDVLRGMVAETSRMLTVERIQKVVADHFRLSVSDLKSKRRTKDVSLPRQIAMALSRELTESSLPAIGEAFGGRDHATVIYACQKVAKDRKEGTSVGQLVEKLVADLRNGL